MKNWFLGLSLSTIIAGTAVADPLVLPAKNNTLSLSIYNRDIALVKDMRSADLNSGLNEIVFDGVAQKIQPETAIIFGDGIKVREQNYSYNLMSYNNLLNQYIGEEVTAVRIDPDNGKDRFEKVRLIGMNGSQPILQTANGIDADFPGRIMFDKIPAGMSNQPTLAAKLDVNRSGAKNLSLAYLTNGLSWKTDYVANVADNQNINLTGWVTINNESGIDYKNAKIQLIAGDVNIVRAPLVRSRGVMLKAVNMMESVDAASIEPESINSYELYTLPTTATLKNHQTKQIALIEKHQVLYAKEFNLTLPFYFGGNDEFEKQHPSITYVVENTAQSNLGISLPAGTVRFYQNDKNGNLQFIGSSNINHTAKEDTLRMNLGNAFNISVSGKITKSSEKEISRSQPDKNSCYNTKILKTYTVEVTVNNAEDSENTVLLTQSFPSDYKIIQESLKGKSKNASTYVWDVPVHKNSKTTLNYVVEIPDFIRNCR